MQTRLLFDSLHNIVILTPLLERFYSLPYISYSREGEH